jgi:hypothetical protein
MEAVSLPPVPDATPEKSRHPSRVALDFQARTPFMAGKLSVNTAAPPSLMKATVRKMSDLVVRASKHGNILDLESALQAGGLVDHSDAYGFTGLHHCAGKNFVDCMEILINYGADLDAQTKNGVTPMIYAASSNSTVAMSLLLENGADPNKPSSTGFTPLITAATQHNLEAMSLLLERNKLKRDSVDKGGWTALHHVAQLGHVDSAEMLVARGCIPTIIDYEGVDALHLATKNGHTTTAIFLHNTPGSGKTTTSYGCAKAPYLDVVDMDWCLAPYRQPSNSRSVTAKLRKMDHSKDPKYNIAVETQVEKEAKMKQKMRDRKERKKVRAIEHDETQKRIAAMGGGASPSKPPAPKQAKKNLGTADMKSMM